MIKSRGGGGGGGSIVELERLTEKLERKTSTSLEPRVS